MALETDLPVLKIGCGNVMMANRCPEHNCGDFCENLGHIGYGDTCQHNLDAVKKNAAAHQEAHKESFEALVDSEGGAFTSPIKLDELLAARDAVLGLAGLTEKELEVK